MYVGIIGKLLCNNWACEKDKSCRICTEQNIALAYNEEPA
jgi:hypothetical protein